MSRMFAVFLTLNAAFLAQQPTAHPIGVKAELLFADDSESIEPKSAWHTVVPAVVVESGALKKLSQNVWNGC